MYEDCGQSLHNANRGGHAYQALKDKYLSGFFKSPSVQKHMAKMGLVRILLIICLKKPKNVKNKKMQNDCKKVKLSEKIINNLFLSNYFSNSN